MNNFTDGRNPVTFIFKTFILYDKSLQNSVKNCFITKPKNTLF